MGLGNIFKKVVKQEEDPEPESKEVAKERLQLVLMQDRANVSAEFLEMMKNEIIGVVQKYIDVDEEAMDIRLTTEPNEDGTNGIPKIYANIPIIQIKNESKFGRLQIQNEAGELIGEVGGNKEISKFAVINEGEIFQDDDNEDDIKIESTIIDRKEDVQEEPEVIEEPQAEIEEIQEEIEGVQEEESTTVKNEIVQEDVDSILEDSIDELEEYFEDSDDEEDVTFDDLLKAAEAAENDEEDEEIDDMKRMVEESSAELYEELEEDSLLQKLSDIDEDENEVDKNEKKSSEPKNNNFSSKKKKHRYKK